MRSIFTVHAGEFLVGEHIEREFKGKSKKNVWVPTKDTGVDLLVTNQENTKAISLQVKFSKDFLPMMKLPPSVQKDLTTPRTLQSASARCSGGWTTTVRKLGSAALN